MLIVEGRSIHFNKQLDNLSDDELFEFCQLNKELRIERDANQNIIIMAPVGGDSGFHEIEILTEVNIWRRKNGGVSFSSSTGFIMPTGAMRSPDACWISEERWSKVTDKQKKKFPPVVPNFVAEIRSSTDTLKASKEKMEEWIENGVQLGWLIDIKNKKTYLYRADGSIEIVKGFDKKLSGEEVMNGFEFELDRLQLP